jgi:hypothetical protein
LAHDSYDEVPRFSFPSRPLVLYALTRTVGTQN